MTTLTHSPSNSDALTEQQNQLRADARELGRLAAQGADALPMLGMKVAYAAANGIISAVKDANGTDDYTRLYTEEYIPAMSKKAVHEHSKGGLKSNISKLRQIGIAATKPTCDFIDVLTRVKDARDQALKDDPKAKIKGAFPAYVDAARKQNEQDDDLTDDQIKELIAKPEADAPELKDWLEAMHKRAQEIVTGENKHGIRDQSDELIQIEQLLGQRLAAMMLKQQHDEVRAKAIELGILKDDAPEGVVEMLEAAE